MLFAALAVAIGTVFAATPAAFAVDPPKITPSGRLTDQAVVRVELNGLIPYNTYRVSICDGTYRGEVPNCDTDPNYSRTFYTEETSYTANFPVRKSFKPSRNSPTITCAGSTGAICYLVLVQYGPEEYTSETRVSFF